MVEVYSRYVRDNAFGEPHTLANRAKDNLPGGVEFSPGCPNPLRRSLSKQPHSGLDCGSYLRWTTRVQKSSGNSLKAFKALITGPRGVFAVLGWSEKVW